MTAKEFLAQAWDIDRRIENKIDERDRLESRLTAGRVANLSGMPRGGHGDWTNAADSVLRLTEQINAEISRLCEIKTQVIEAINAVEDEKYRRVLEMRYRNYMTWEQIAENMNYELRWIYELHGRALLCVRVPEEYCDA